MNTKSQWFSDFEKRYRETIQRADLCFSADGKERLLAYRVLSNLEMLTSRLWGIMRALEAEREQNERRRESNLV